MNSKKIWINNKAIGEDCPTYIVAEIGINHNGSLALARKLIDAARDAGVDGVKFQKRHLLSLYPRDMLDHPEKYEQQFQYMIPILKSVELPEADMVQLRAYALEKELDFLCTPFDKKSADFLEKIGIHAFKIASADLNNLDLLAHISAKGLPMIVSTGMSYREEIGKTVDLLKESGVEFAILHCRSAYPVWPREVNLKMINWLKRYDVPVGYSGHDIGIVIPLVAASMGASIIEKHITLDKKMAGPDHKISLEAFEFKRMVRDIRIADLAMAKEDRFLLRGEVLNREVFGKSLTAKKTLPRGTVLTREMIRVKGPGKGLSPTSMDDLVGTKISRDIGEGEVFLETDLFPLVDSGAPVGADFKSQWGLIARFSDFHEMMVFDPKVIEIHLAEKDFQLAFTPRRKYSQHLVLHVAEYLDGKLMDLCSSDEGIRSGSVALVNQTIALAAELAPFFQGVPKVIAHPGAMSLNAKLDKAQLKKALLVSLEEINSLGVELLLENLPPYPWYFGGAWKGNFFMDADEIAMFCRETGIHIVFDTSHAALYCNAKEIDLCHFIKTVRPYIRHIHMGDAYGLDGEGIQIHEGDMDFDRIMPLLSDYRGSWVPEIWRGHQNNARGFLIALERMGKYNF
ncbi:MAG: N-acetylneuraminate synthase family protein [Proteobacteria bacterium]|nr:N-acetylneuraminate synthase family protein [Pseudomonadota bacterium]MBU4133643.1 N-acetylneuraminate synthase family protein [Pseudomonadota bacterium]